jgi:hypothetical protein
MHIFAFRRLVLTLSLLPMLAASVFGQGKAKPAAHVNAVHGALMIKSDAGWDTLAAKSDVPADRLIVALFGADFRSLNGAVEGKMIADVGQRGPFPVLEAAASFHVTADCDLSVTLQRGILVLVNTKKTGPAKVHLRVSDETFEIALHDSTSKLGIEVYGRHVPGPPKLTNVKADAPVANAAFFALAGEVVIKAEKQATRLQAPPGAALLLWDNLTRMPDLHRFDKLPDSVKPFSAEEKKQFETLAGFAKAWASKPGEIGKTLEIAVDSKNALERKAAVVALGALDDLPRLVQVLSNKDHADARDMAVLVVRHWLGEAPGQSIRMYNYLTKSEGYTPTQAKNLLYLCNGLEEDKLRQPATYDLLILGLNAPKMPTRELAHWHLVRLVPGGKEIVYDAAAPEAARLQSSAAWRRLVPEGELPAPPKKR